MLAFAAATTFAVSRRHLRQSLRPCARRARSVATAAAGASSSPAAASSPAASPATSSSSPSPSHPQLLERRASIDLGSGATKLMVADVDPRTHRIVRTLFGEERTVSFSLTSKQTADGSLPDHVMALGLEVLHDFRRIADDLLAAAETEAASPEAPAVRPRSGIAAIATEVFRKAPNGPAFLARVRAETGIDVHPVTQHEEAEVGFMTAAAFAKPGQPDSDIVAWDSGGGSFQISGMKVDAATGKERLRVPYMGSLGSGVVFQLGTELFGKPRDPTGAQPAWRGQAPPAVACNPLSQDEFDQLVEHLMARLPPTASSSSSSSSLPSSTSGQGNAARAAAEADGDDFAWVAESPCVTAIGGPTSMCRLPGLLLLNGTEREEAAEADGYTLDEVLAAVAVVLGKTDEEIAALPARLTQVDLAAARAASGGGASGKGKEEEEAAAAEGPPTLGALRLEPHLMATKLALLVAVMRRCGVRRVRHQFAIGSCPGLLVHPGYFPAE